MGTYTVKRATIPGFGQTRYGQILVGGEHFAPDPMNREFELLLTDWDRGEGNQEGVRLVIVSRDWLVENCVPGHVGAAPFDCEEEQALIRSLPQSTLPADREEERRELAEQKRLDEGTEAASIVTVFNDPDRCDRSILSESQGSSQGTGGTRRSRRSALVRRVTRLGELPPDLKLKRAKSFRELCERAYEEGHDGYRVHLRRTLHRLHARIAEHGQTLKQDPTGSKRPQWVNTFRAWLAHQGLGNEHFQVQNEVIATFQTLHDGIQQGVDDPFDIFIIGQWDAPGSVIFGLLSAIAAWRTFVDPKQTKRQKAMSLVEAVLPLGKSIAQATAAVQTWAAVGGEVPAQATAFGFGGALNLVAATKNAVHMWDVIGIGKRLSFVETQLAQGQSPAATRMAGDPRFKYFAEKIRKKNLRRFAREASSLVSQASGFSGGMVATGVSVGFASSAAAIPIAGWALIAAAMAGGLGVELYKFIRHQIKKRKLKKLRTFVGPLPAGADRDAPSWIRTTGEWHRFRIAFAILRVANNPFIREDDPRFADELVLGQTLAWIVCGGDTFLEAQERAVAMGMCGIMAFLKG